MLVLAVVPNEFFSWRGTGEIGCPGAWQTQISWAAGSGAEAGSSVLRPANSVHVQMTSNVVLVKFDHLKETVVPQPSTGLWARCDSATNTRVHAAW